MVDWMATQTTVSPFLSTFSVAPEDLKLDGDSKASFIKLCDFFKVNQSQQVKNEKLRKNFLGIINIYLITNSWDQTSKQWILFSQFFSSHISQFEAWAVKKENILFVQNIFFPSQFASWKRNHYRYLLINSTNYSILELGLSVALFELNRTIWQDFIAFLWLILTGAILLVLTLRKGLDTVESLSAEALGNLSTIFETRNCLR